MLSIRFKTHCAPNNKLKMTMKTTNAIQTVSEPGQTAVEFETKQQLATRLGVSVRTIDNLLARGLPHIKLTKKLTRFPRAATDQWLAERQVRRA